MTGSNPQPREESQQVRDLEYFRKTLQFSGLSYREIAEEVGCTSGFIGHIARGYRKVVTADLATKIAEVVDVPLRYLFTPVPSRHGGRVGPRKRTTETSEDADKVTVAA